MLEFIEVGLVEFGLSGKSVGTDAVDFGAARGEGGGGSAKGLLIFIREGARAGWEVVADSDDFFDE
jgi:hypothetical protein